MPCVAVKRLARWCLGALLFTAAVPGAPGGVSASEPLSVAGQPAYAAAGYTLLLDPVERHPVGLLQPPAGPVVLERRTLTLHVLQENSASSGLPVLRVTDVLPEFWAEPSVWAPFRAGPAAFSGLGRDQRIKDWAGRPETDRRAYALDNGLTPRRSAASFSPPGTGRLRWVLDTRLFSLAWNGVAGRVYAVEYAADLHTPFRTLRTFIHPEDGEVTLSFSPDGPAGFYRVSELSP